MKRKLIVLSFMLSFSLFDTTGIKAQNDAFFVNSSEQRTASNMEQGFYFKNLDVQQNGVDFEGLVINDEAPLANGMLLMSAAGFIYLMNKRRKENE